MSSLQFWGTEHFKLFAVLAWLCSIKHYTPQAEGAGMSITQQYPLVTSHQHSSKKTNFNLPAVSIQLLSALTLQEKTWSTKTNNNKTHPTNPLPNQNSSKIFQKLSNLYYYLNYPSPSLCIFLCFLTGNKISKLPAWAFTYLTADTQTTFICRITLNLLLYGWRWAWKTHQLCRNTERYLSDIWFTP